MTGSAGLAVLTARRSEGVDCACAGHFLRTPDAAARARTIEIALLRGGGTRLEIWVTDLHQPSRLRKELACQVHAPACAIAPLRRPPTGSASQRDAIALAAYPGRLAALELDPSAFSLRPSSLHHPAQVDPLASSHPPGSLALASDPDGRALALLRSGGRELSIFPAASSSDFLSSTPSSSSHHPAAALHPSYTLSLPQHLSLEIGIDIVFLHGYTEPTLAVLHERTVTWAGTAAQARDTNAVTALSINTSAKKHPTIWSCDRLPFECYKLCATPLPLGGVLIIAPNMLLHRSQGSRYTLATSPTALGGKEADLDDEFGDTLHHHYHHRELVAGGISNPPPAVTEHAERSQEDAELFGCHPAFIDSSCCVLPCCDGSLFTVMLSQGVRGVGRMSLQRSKTAHVQAPACAVTVAPRLIFLGSQAGRSSLLLAQPVSTATDDVNQQNNQEEHHADTNGNTSVSELTPVAGRKRKRLNAVASQYELKEVSSITNIGAIRDAGTLELDSVKPEGVAGKIPPCKELAAAAGCGHEGSVALMRRRVEVDVLVGVELAGVKAVHAVQYRPSASSMSTSKRSDYLIICKDKSTMVLEAQEELQELTADRTDLVLNECTVGCGTLFSGARIAQATPSGIRLAAGTVWAQDVTLDALEAFSENDEHVASVSFVDPNALVLLSNGSVRFLEGDTELHKMSRNKAAESALPSEPASAACLAHDEAGYFGRRQGPIVAIAMQSGRLVVVSLSGKKRALLLNAPGLTDGLQILSADGGEKSKSAGERSEVRRGPQPPGVIELRLDTFGDAMYTRPLLTAVRKDGEVLFYRGFERANALQFARISSEWCNGGVDTGGYALARIQGVRAEEPVHGVQVAGETPLLALTWQGNLFIHPMRCSEPTVCASQFDNSNCPQGLVVATARDLQFVQLAKGYELAQPWPTRRLWLDCTPTRIATPSALTSGEGPIAVSVRRLRAHRDRPMRDDQDSHGRICYAASRAAAYRRKGFEDSEELRAIDPNSGTTTWREELEPGERCLSLRAMDVLNVSTGHYEEMYVVGTLYHVPEDVPSRGRHLLFRPERKRSKKGAKRRQFDLSRILAKQSAGACSAIASMNGYMLVCAGTKVTVQCWTGSDLRQLAFYDTPLHITALSVVKNFALVADVHKGVRFLQWKANEQQLEPLSKLYAEMSCLSAEFALEHGSLALLCTDAVGTLHRLEYKRNSTAAWKGAKLLPISATALQASASLMIRLGMLDPYAGESSPTRQAAMVLGHDGSITYAIPVPEQAGGFMSRIEDAVSRTHPQSPSCFNPKERRQPLGERAKPEAAPARADAIDFDILSAMLDLPLSAQANCAASASGSLGEAHAALSKVYTSTSWF